MGRLGRFEIISRFCSEFGIASMVRSFEMGEDDGAEGEGTFELELEFNILFSPGLFLLRGVKLRHHT